MSFDRVTVTRAILGADGRLLVEQGVTGTIVSRDEGMVGVLFDDGTGFVELSGCGQRLQQVPFIDTIPTRIESPSMRENRRTDGNEEEHFVPSIVARAQHAFACASRDCLEECTGGLTEEKIAVRKLTFYHRVGSDYLDTYKSDAAVVARILGLTLLTVHKSHATAEHLAGVSHTAIPLYVKDAWFAELRAHGFEPVIAA